MKKTDHTVIILVVLTVVFAIVFAVSFKISTTYEAKEKINYKQEADVSYNVKLKKNEHFDKDVTEDMDYVALLIDKLKFNFDYGFSVDKNYDFDYTYYVIADVNVYNTEDGHVIYNKRFNIVDPVTKQSLKRDNIKINDSFKINYSTYNALVNEFKSSYNVFAESEIVLKINVQINSTDKAITQPVHLERSSIVKIPLSKQLIDISPDVASMNESGGVDIMSTDNNVNTITSLVAYSTGFLTFLFILLSVIRIIIINSRKTLYQKKRDKILKEYDRVISNTKDDVDIKRDAIITEISSFEELLDMRDNLNLPILYYEHIKDEESYFVVKNYKDVYLYILSERDLENEKNNKK